MGGKKSREICRLHKKDMKLLKNIRLVLYEVHKQRPPRDKYDLDVLSYRLLDIVRNESCISLYNMQRGTWNGRV